MKKIKFLMIAMMAIIASVGFVACSDDDDDISNTERYQRAVDENVKANKKSNKAILLVAFGSTWQQAYDAFDATKRAYESQFSGYDVYLSFSSAICINRAAAGENVAPRNFYAPQYWLEAFGRVKYQEIIVQSLQVIPGEEYGRVVNAVKDFANNANGDIDDEYLSKVTLKIGLPLLADAETDVNNVAMPLRAWSHSWDTVTLTSMTLIRQTSATLSWKRHSRRLTRTTSSVRLTWPTTSRCRYVAACRLPVLRVVRCSALR